MKTSFFYTLLLLSLVSCNAVQENSIVSDKSAPQFNRDFVYKYEYPKFNIAVPEDRFAIKASQDHLLTTSKYSRIHIPANAFTTKDGKSVTGNVDLTFKEYQSSAEILASKLPMVYVDEKGEISNFESAGMFEIRASQNGEELKLKDSKEILVELGSSNREKFNFYDLNPENNQWELIKKDCKPIKNKYKKEKKKELDSLRSVELEKPRKAVGIKKDAEMFDIKFNFLESPWLEELNGVMWMFTDSDSSVNVAKEKLYNKDYKQVTADPVGNEELEFNLQFINMKDTIRVKAAPVLNGKLLSRQKDKYAKFIESMQENAKKDKKLQDQISKEKELLRAFKVDDLGIYNYDRQFKDPEAVMILAAFDFDGMNQKDLEFVSVYLIPSSKNAVIQYIPETFEKFAINPKENNKLVAVLPDNQVYYLSNKDLSAINFEDLRNKHHTFKLKKYNSKINEVEKLDELIAKI